MGKNKFPISKDFPDAKMFLLFFVIVVFVMQKNEKEVSTLQIPLLFIEGNFATVFRIPLQ